MLCNITGNLSRLPQSPPLLFAHSRSAALVRIYKAAGFVCTFVGIVACILRQRCRAAIASLMTCPISPSLSVPRLSPHPLPPLYALHGKVICGPTLRISAMLTSLGIAMSRCLCPSPHENVTRSRRTDCFSPLCRVFLASTRVGVATRRSISGHSVMRVAPHPIALDSRHFMPTACACILECG